MAARRVKLPALVLERAKSTARKPPAPALPRARRDTKQKVIAALKKLHPMD